MTSSVALGAPPFGKLLPYWQLPQTELHAVVRWNAHSNIEGFPIRQQSTLAHVHGIVLLTHVFNSIVGSKNLIRGFDHYLLLRAISIHDDGEGIVHSKNGIDVMTYNKTDADDVQEFKAFQARIRTLPEEVQYDLLLAFMLQFGTKSEEEAARFPLQAQQLLGIIRNKYWREATAHEALERWDYILYGLEQYQNLNNPRILQQILLYNAPKIDRLCEKLSAVKKVFWTQDTRNWCLEFVTHHREMFPDFDDQGRPRK